MKLQVIYICQNVRLINQSQSWPGSCVWYLELTWAYTIFLLSDDGRFF